MFFFFFSLLASSGERERNIIPISDNVFYLKTLITSNHYFLQIYIAFKNNVMLIFGKTISWLFSYRNKYKV